MDKFGGPVFVMITLAWPVIIYLVGVVLTATAASSRERDGVSWAMCALFFSPVLALLALMAAGDHPKVRKRMEDAIRGRRLEQKPDSGFRAAGPGVPPGTALGGEAALDEMLRKNRARNEGRPESSDEDRREPKL